MTPAERFGLLLTRQRMRAALTQEELGRLVGIHRSEVGLLERGGRGPRLDTALQLAAGVETELADLLTGMRWTPGVVEVGGVLAVGGGHDLARAPRAGHA